MKLGVLGGMGPKATALFFEKLVEHTVAYSDQEHIDTIILNHSSIPDRTEVIQKNKKNAFLTAVQKDFNIFEQAGVDHIAIPCNTSHYFYEEMQKMTNIKIIHMVQETVNVLYDKYGEGSKIAILATDGTIQTGIYESACEDMNLIPYVPNGHTQKQIMNMIYRVKKSEEINSTELEQIIEEVVEKECCTAVILGCTELSTIPINEKFAKLTIDPLEVLVHQSIIRSNRQSTLMF